MIILIYKLPCILFEVIAGKPFFKKKVQFDIGKADHESC
jgi:hypothetical protein